LFLVSDKYNNLMQVAVEEYSDTHI